MKSTGPRKYTITEYWQVFKSELLHLYAKVVPKNDVDLMSFVKKVFHEGSEEAKIDFCKQITQLPFEQQQKKQPASNQLDITNTKLEPDLDFLKYYVIGMRMAMLGERIESLSKVSLSGDSQKSVGTQIDNLRKLFSVELLPDVTSAATCAFAKVYLAHSKRYAAGRVYTKDSISNGFLAKYIPDAQRSCEQLNAKIKKHENDSLPTHKIKRELTCVLATKHVWLGNFESLFINFVNSYLNLSKPKAKPEDGAKASSKKSSSYFRWFGWPSLPSWPSWPSWPKFLTWSKPIAHTVEIKPLEDIHLNTLNQKFLTCEAMCQALTHHQEVCREAFEFKVIPEEQEVEHTSTEFVDAIYMANQMIAILKILQYFYSEVVQAVEMYPSYDAFTSVYFKLVAHTHKQLLETLNKEQPKLSSDTSGIIRCLKGFVMIITDAREHQEIWYKHFHENFSNPQAIIPLFSAQHKGQGRRQEQRQVQKSPDLLDKLDNFFSKLKL